MSYLHMMSLPLLDDPTVCLCDSSAYGLSQEPAMMGYMRMGFPTGLWTTVTLLNLMMIMLPVSEAGDVNGKSP